MEKHRGLHWTLFLDIRFSDRTIILNPPPFDPSRITMRSKCCERDAQYGYFHAAQNAAFILVFPFCWNIHRRTANSKNRFQGCLNPTPRPGGELLTQPRNRTFAKPSQVRTLVSVLGPTLPNAAGRRSSTAWCRPRRPLRLWNASWRRRGTWRKRPPGSTTRRSTNWTGRRERSDLTS